MINRLGHFTITHIDLPRVRWQFPWLLCSAVSSWDRHGRPTIGAEHQVEGIILALGCLALNTASPIFLASSSKFSQMSLRF